MLRSIRWGFRDGVYFGNNRPPSIDHKRDFRFFETGGIGLYLFRGQGYKIFFPQAADKKRTKNTAVLPFRDHAVKFQMFKNAVLVAYKGNFLLEWVNCLNESADSLLHFIKAIDFFLIGKKAGFHN